MILALSVIVALTLHEWAHAWVALALGDSTAADLGRCSLNPLRHVDPVGSVLVPVLSVTLADVLVGWGRPVPVRTERVHGGRAGLAAVFIAGPLVNALVVLIAGMAYLVTGWDWLLKFGVANLFLCVVNMLPIPGLDGWKLIRLTLKGRTEVRNA